MLLLIWICPYIYTLNYPSTIYFIYMQRILRSCFSSTVLKKDTNQAQELAKYAINFIK